MSKFWIFRQSSFTCQTIGESNQHLTLHVRSQLFPHEACFSFVHAKCISQERVLLWSALLCDKPVSLPWFLVGDFNVILNVEEKSRALPFLEMMKGLNYHISCC